MPSDPFPFNGKLTGTAPELERLVLPFIGAREETKVRKEMEHFKGLSAQDSSDILSLAQAMDSDVDPLTVISIEMSDMLLTEGSIPESLIKRKIELESIKECNHLLLNWIATLVAFVRFKRGNLRHLEFDAFMLPWLTAQALRCYASWKFYPYARGTPDGLKTPDLWLFHDYPSKLILQQVRESLPPDQTLPEPAIQHLQEVTGLTVRFSKD